MQSSIMGGVTPSIRGWDAQWTSHMQGGVGRTLSEWLSTRINDPMISDSKHEISEAYQVVILDASLCIGSASLVLGSAGRLWSSLSPTRRVRSARN